MTDGWTDLKTKYQFFLEKATELMTFINDCPSVPRGHYMYTMDVKMIVVW